MMELNPDAVLGISGALYDSAVNADMVIDSLSISSDMTVSIKGEQFGHSLSIFDDLTPSALSVLEDDSIGTWRPIIVGPDGTDSLGNSPNALNKHLQIKTGGTIKVGLKPDTDGGLLIDETHIAGYSTVGTKTLELTYAGADQGDAYFGDYDSGNAGVKYDHSEAMLNVRGSISIQNPSTVRTDINVADGADVTANNKAKAIDRPDTRDTNEPPSYYYALGRGTYSEFKRRTTIGAPGSGMYVSLLIDVPWGDASGGPVIQQCSPGDNIYRRKSLDTATWGTWYKIADGADVTDYTDTRVANALNQDSVLTIQRPGGATYAGGAGETGAIKITLPQSWTWTMLRFMVHVYDYNQNLSFTLVVGGYTYSHLENPRWVNTFAQLIGNKDADNAVRFGHDGTKCCIIIGETTSTWDYLKVTVKDFQAGYRNYSVDQWDDGWSISLITTLPANIDKTYSNSLLDANAVKTLVGSDLEPAEAGAVKNFSSLTDDGGTLSISNSVLRVLGADGIQLEPGADLFVNSEAGNSGSIYFLTAAGEYVEFAANYSDGILFISPKTYDTSGLWVGYSDAGTTDMRFRRIVTSSHSLDMFVADRSGSSGWIRLNNADNTSVNTPSTELWVNPSAVQIEDWSGTTGAGGRLEVANHIIAKNGIKFGSIGGDTLDDYEEGVYTVTCTPATSGSVTLSGNRDVLRYQKIGNWCHVQGNIMVGSVYLPVGRVGVSVPFTIADTEFYDYVAGSLAIWDVAVDTGCLWMNTIIRNDLAANKVFIGQNRSDNSQILYGDGGEELAAGSILYFDFTYKTA
jgi:hypothetical protein